MINSGIYMILNIVNNKCYVGQTKNFHSRKLRHFSNLRNNKHCSSHLQSSYNKYGENNFVFIVLERIENLVILTERELYWIELKNSLNEDSGYNLGNPKINSNLEIRESTKEKLRLQAYNQFYKNNPDMTLEDFMNGKRAKDLRILTGKQNKKVIYAFNKLTGEKELEFESITAACKYFGFKSDSLSSIIDKDNRTCKGYFLVKEENYDKNKIYKKIKKSKIN